MIFLLLSLFSLTYEITIAAPPVEPQMAWITSYTGNPNETDDDPNNAAGRKPKWGDIACPAYLQLGDKVQIGDIGIFTCADRMAKRYRQESYYDIYAGTGPEAERAARVWGRQLLEIKLL